MGETVGLIVAVIIGFALGGFFFGGLWWTVRRSLSVRRPALLFLASVVSRSTITVFGFYVVADGRWQQLAACLLGFLLARLMVMRMVGKPDEPIGAAARKASHAP